MPQWEEAGLRPVRSHGWIPHGRTMGSGERGERQRRRAAGRRSNEQALSRISQCSTDATPLALDAFCAPTRAWPDDGRVDLYDEIPHFARLLYAFPPSPFVFSYLRVRRRSRRVRLRAGGNAATSPLTAKPLGRKRTFHGYKTRPTEVRQTRPSDVSSMSGHHESLKSGVAREKSMERLYPARLSAGTVEPIGNFQFPPKCKIQWHFRQFRQRDQSKGQARRTPTPFSTWVFDAILGCLLRCLRNNRPLTPLFFSCWADVTKVRLATNNAAVTAVGRDHNPLAFSRLPSAQNRSQFHSPTSSSPTPHLRFRGLFSRAPSYILALSPLPPEPGCVSSSTQFFSSSTPI